MAQSLQARYLDGEPRALVKLYSECRYLARPIARSYLKRISLRKTEDELDEAIHVAVSRILCRYHNGFRVRSFPALLRLEIRTYFGGDRGPKKTFLQSIGRLEGDPPDERKGSPVHTLDDLRAEPHGNEIFFDLCLYPSYRDALISMATYVSGDRLLTESGKLRDIHRVMHGKKEADGKRGSRNMERNAPADTRNKPASSKRKQAHSYKGRPENA
jgi:hypothetical protein